MGGTGHGRTALVVALTVLLSAAALTVVPVLDRAPLAGDGLPWPVLAGLFALTELVVLHVQVRREQQAVSLSELATVLALLLAAPGAHVLARAVGPLAVLVLHRRSPPLKAAFNTALFAAEAALAVHVFALLAGPDPQPGPRCWLAACAAVAVAGTAGTAVLQLVVAAYDGALRVRGALREVATGVALGLVVAVVGLVAAVCLTADLRTAPLLAAVAAAVLAGYRAYGRLSDRHLALERLYRFSQVVTSSSEIDAVLRSVLAEARELLRAEHVVIRFLPAVVGRSALQVRLDEDGALVRSELAEDPDPAWLRELLTVQGRPLVAVRGTRDARAAGWLAGHGLREAVVVPLRGEAGVIGSLRVADRTGELRPFEAADVQLLQRVAESAGASLQNGRLVHQLRHDALHDVLTGLPNRARLSQVLTDAVQQVAVGRSDGATVMVLDLDGFKDVNDSLGHAVGDALLQEVSRRMVHAVGASGLVARLGGDEFAIVLPSTAHQADVLAAGGRVLQALAAPVLLDGMSVQVGGSVGVALAPVHGTEAQVLLKRADTAMYDAKGSGGGLRVYQVGLDDGDPRRLQLVQGLRDALAGDQLDLHLQPVVDARSGRVLRVEALVRWSHPELGDVRPDELVPLAERSGLIAPLTGYVLARSLAACAGWLAAGRELGVAVNLATRTLGDGDIVAEVREQLARSGVPGRLLTLEVAESVVMADPARSAVVLAELRELGVRLSLDDFGSGRSSLGHLTQLPVHEIKVDRAFVRRLTSRPDDVAVVRSVVELGRGLRLDVVAEGVEDGATWAALRALGCTSGQGWHLGRPMPLAALGPWLADLEAAGLAPAA